jgi:hypothetical protein
MDSNKKMPENAGKLECKLCDFKCSKQSNYKKHLLTRKHQKREISNDLAMVSNEKMPKNAETNIKIVCEVCNKSYKDNSGLWRHKKKCIKTDEEEKKKKKNKKKIMILFYFC